MTTRDGGRGIVCSMDTPSVHGESTAPDNSSAGLEALLKENLWWRDMKWPTPFDRTTHHLRRGDARSLDWIADESVHLVVTSPPYWTLKEYEHSVGQLGDVEDYEAFLTELDKVWRHCARVLVPGGRVCCVVGDVCLPRRLDGRHRVMPLHADLQVRSRRVGLDSLTPILWHKIANGVTEAEGNGAGYYGKPFQPGGIVKNDVEFILFLRKGEGYRSVSRQQKVLSMLSREEMSRWFRSIWTDVPGASTRRGHPAPYPVDLAERLIRMFSFAGDTVLDPFVGSGTTTLAAIRAGRNSIGVELERRYIDLARDAAREATRQVKTYGATVADVLSVGEP
jgi:site-specific DNA-methyltransferase (adenine-specific)